MGHHRRILPCKFLDIPVFSNNRSKSNGMISKFLPLYFLIICTSRVVFTSLLEFYRLEFNVLFEKLHLKFYCEM